jgi:hypothetical protein
MPSWRPPWSEPRTWFLTVRLLEGAVLVLVIAMVVTAYHGWRQVELMGPGGIDGQPDPLSLWQKITVAVAFGGFSGAGTADLVVSAVLVLVAVAVLYRVRPVSHARLLRWELLALGAVQLLVSLVHTFAWVLVAFTRDPYNQQGTITDGDTVTTVDVYEGPSRVATALMNLGLPVTSIVVLAIAALWWLRLPADFDEEDELDEAGAAATADSAPRPKPRRSWRPAPAQDANLDDIVLDGVEQIEPVERLHPRETGRGDGSTSSGYDDYFRRF